jgi:GT2 family glycosyltransferase
MEKKISVVLVTYNRLSYLKECLNSLRNQTYKPDQILVINNDSTDGTTNWLKEQTDLVVINQGNLGGAGGFYTGIKTAYDQGFDYIWVMDDDVEPELNCLEILMNSFKDFGDKYDVLMPDRFYDKDKNLRWRYGTQFNFKNPFKNMGVGKGICASDDITKKILPIVAFPFEGPMFKREVIEKIGDVEKEFFINHDDTDFAIRTIKSGFKIGVVTDALLPKKIFPDFTKGFKVDFKLYYLTRNSIILDRKFGNDFFALIRGLRINGRVVLVLIYTVFRKGDFQLLKGLYSISNAIIDGFKWKIIRSKYN